MLESGEDGTGTVQSPSPADTDEDRSPALMRTEIISERYGSATPATAHYDGASGPVMQPERYGLRMEEISEFFSRDARRYDRAFQIY